MQAIDTGETGMAKEVLLANKDDLSCKFELPEIQRLPKKGFFQVCTESKVKNGMYKDAQYKSFQNSSHVQHAGLRNTLGSVPNFF